MIIPQLELLEEPDRRQFFRERVDGYFYAIPAVQEVSPDEFISWLFRDKPVAQSSARQLFSAIEPVPLLAAPETVALMHPAGIVKRGTHESGPVERYTNMCFVPAPGEPALPRGTDLAAGREYYLRVDIGEWSADSILVNPSRLPVKWLPPSETAYKLTVSLTSTHFAIDARERSLYLPTAGGPAFTCDCEPCATTHTCEAEERSTFLYIPVVCPARPRAAQMRLSIAFRGNLVQIHEITAEVADTEQARIGARAQTAFSLSANLTHLDVLPERDLAIATADGENRTHAIVLGGLDGEVVPFSLTPGQSTSAVVAARAALRDVHMDRGKPPVSLLDVDNGKTPEQLVADLRRVVPLGRRLWNLLLEDRPDVRRRLREHLRAPATIQVARTGSTSFVFPWALVYDIPLEDGNPDDYRPCRVVRSLDRSSPAPASCPYESEHRLNTLCPYGFWGFRHTIEQPGSVTAPRTLPVAIVLPDEPEMIVCLSKRLNQDLTGQHLRRLRADLSGVRLTICDARKQVVDALANVTLPLAYFYCHGRRELIEGAAEPMPYLEIGVGEKIMPGDITAWSDGLWPDSHWKQVSPLVFINGCHTVEITPDSLAHFVDAFSGVYASGVIGTETDIHQVLAGEVAELFWQRFRGGLTVGSALSQVRLVLLGKCNLLGLAYTAYCSASLRLMSHPVRTERGLP